MNFEEYLISKKIDAALLKEGEPARWQEWKELFEQMSAASFTSQKLYLINPLRRKYMLKEMVAIKDKKSEEPAVGSPVVKSAKPVFKPKIN